jgi:hypothetical protein
VKGEWHLLRQSSRMNELSRRVSAAVADRVVGGVTDERMRLELCMTDADCIGFRTSIRNTTAHCKYMPAASSLQLSVASTANRNPLKNPVNKDLQAQEFGLLGFLYLIARHFKKIYWSQGPENRAGSAVL